MMVAMHPFFSNWHFFFFPSPFTVEDKRFGQGGFFLTRSTLRHRLFSFFFLCLPERQRKQIRKSASSGRHRPGFLSSLVD